MPHARTMGKANQSGDDGNQNDLDGLGARLERANSCSSVEYASAHAPKSAKFLTSQLCLLASNQMCREGQGVQDQLVNEDLPAEWLPMSRQVILSRGGRIFFARSSRSCGSSCVYERACCFSTASRVGFSLLVPLIRVQNVQGAGAHQRRGAGTQGGYTDC